MELLVRSTRRVAPGEGNPPGEGEPAPPAGAAPPEQALEPRSLFRGKALEVYSRMQAKTLGEGLVSPAGSALKFDSLVPATILSRQGPIPRDDAGIVLLTDARGGRWPLRFYVVGPRATGPWLNEASTPEEGQKLQAFILAGDWPRATDPALRKALRKASPNEPLLQALDLLGALEKPAGQEALLQEAAARLAALLPRNPEALSLCAAAYLAAGRPESAGRLKGWQAGLGPSAP
jgi:hypothetical protein